MSRHLIPLLCFWCHKTWQALIRETYASIDPNPLSIVDLIQALQERQQPQEVDDHDMMLPFKTQEFEGFRDVSNVRHDDGMESGLWNSWLL